MHLEILVLQAVPGMIKYVNMSIWMLESSAETTA